MARSPDKDDDSSPLTFNNSPLIFYLLIGLGAFSITSILSASMVGKLNEGEVKDVRLLNHPKLVIVRELAHEDLFRSTLKSCIPMENPRCKSFTPKVNNQNFQRIAIISSPGDAASSLYNRIEPIQQLHNQRKDRVGPLIDSFSRSSVPPYGYGMTHGLTKIIRLIPQPLLLEVTDALQSVLEPGESHRDITLSDLRAGLRLIVRFHCRLSAVAAHTALLSVSYMELTDIETVLRKLQAFLVPDDPPVGNGQLDDKMLETIPDDDQESLFDAQMSYGAQMLSYVEQAARTDVHHVLGQVLSEELRSSKNLTVWPCPSFWTVGDDPEPLVLSPIVQRLAKALSPDCNDPLAQCWVERDKCEARGVGACR